MLWQYLFLRSPSKVELTPDPQEEKALGWVLKGTQKFSRYTTRIGPAKYGENPEASGQAWNSLCCWRTTGSSVLIGHEKRGLWDEAAEVDSSGSRAWCLFYARNKRTQTITSHSIKFIINFVQDREDIEEMVKIKHTRIAYLPVRYGDWGTIKRE